MKNLLRTLEDQLSSKYQNEAEECIELFNWLKEIDGFVWNRRWKNLVSTFNDYGTKRYYLNIVGETLLKGIRI